MPGDGDAAVLMRGRLVDAALNVLIGEGPAAVQARRVARDVGASTMAVYHYFGGMPELLRAVADEGFRRLEARVAAVTASSDPVHDLCRLAFAYLAAAQESKNLYDLMFGLSSPGGHRPKEGEKPVVLVSVVAAAAYAPVMDAAERAMRAGRIRPADPTVVAAQFWTVLHGYLTLASAGQLGQFDDSFSQVLVPLGVNLLVGLGDTPAQAAASAAEALDEMGRTSPRG